VPNQSNNSHKPEMAYNELKHELKQKGFEAQVKYFIELDDSIRLARLLGKRYGKKHYCLYATLNYIIIDCQPLLLIAIAHHSLNCVKFLIQHGIDVNAPDLNNEIALSHAIIKYNNSSTQGSHDAYFEIIKDLIAAGSNCNLKSNLDHQTAIMLMFIIQTVE